MSFVALHRGECTSLATDRLWLDAHEVSLLDDARTLLTRLEGLEAGRLQSLQAEREAARAEGLAAGRREALATEGPQLWNAWERAARASAAQTETLRSALVALSVQIVQRVASDLGPAAVVAALAERAAETLLPDGAAVVRVHPDVAASVRERVQGAPGVLEVRADAAMGRFDCAFDTPAGQLLAGLPTQLVRLARTLHEEAA